MPPCVANPVLPQRSHRPEVQGDKPELQGDKGVSTQPLPLKGDHPIGEISTSLLRGQASLHRCTEQAKQPSPSKQSRCHTQASSQRTGREMAMEMASRITRLAKGNGQND
jgi:hypothetical protein